MAKEMAQSVCQRFVDARFVESVDDKALLIFPRGGSDDAGQVLWVGYAVGLGELERAQIVDGLF
jgi:hypothetical protein